MISQLVISLLLATVSLTFAADDTTQPPPGRRLTQAENMYVQGLCGLDARYHTKVLNGDGPRDFPWAAQVNVNGLLTASVISPRHVLLFNVFEMDKDGNRTLFNDTKIVEKGYCDEEGDWISPKETHALFTVKFVAEQFGGAGYASNVSRVVVLGGCNVIDTYKPLILELSDDLSFDKTHGPLCIAERVSKVLDDYMMPGFNFTVFGLGPKGDMLSSAEFKKKTCGIEHTWNFVYCGRPVNQSKGLCSGDFGGGAIASIEGRSVLLGIFAEGNVNCDVPPQNHPDAEFIDIRAYTDVICRQTGVCPDQKEYIPSTTTQGVYVPGIETESTEEPTESTTITTPEPTTATTEATTEATTPTPETIVAETFEKMKLGCRRHQKPKDLHIHIHLEDYFRGHHY